MVPDGVSMVSPFVPSVVLSSIISVSSPPVAWNEFFGYRVWATLGGLAGNEGKGGNSSSILAVKASVLLSSLFTGPSPEL